MVGRVKVLYLTSELGLELRAVEMSDRAGTALAFEGVLPGCLGIIANGSEGTETGYYYAF